MDLSGLHTTTGYPEDQIVKALRITATQWGVLKDGLMDVFHDNPKLKGLTSGELCQRLNEMCMTPGMGLGDFRRANHAYFMLQAALFAKDKEAERAKQAEVVSNVMRLRSSVVITLTMV